MTIPVFTAGTVLTAAELNTALSASANLLAQQPNTWPFPQTFDGTINQSPGAGESNQGPFLQAADAVQDCIVSGINPTVPSPASLTMTIPAGTAYVLGQRTLLQAAVADTYPASSDTYFSMTNTGQVAYTSVANGAAAPAAPANAINLLKVITNAITAPALRYKATNTGTLGVNTYEFAIVPNDASGHGLPGTALSLALPASGAATLYWDVEAPLESVDVYATAPITSPTPAITAGASGGTLAAGTYLGALVAHNATSYGAVSPSVSVVVALDGTMVFTWANPANETAMDIYATTAGSTTLGLVASGVTGTTYTYTGAVAPGAAAPTSAYSPLGLVASGITGGTYTYTGETLPGVLPPTAATSSAIQYVLGLLPPISDDVDFFMNDLRNLEAVAGNSVFMTGYNTFLDGGEGTFLAEASGGYVDNGGTIIVPNGGNGSVAWVRQYSGRADIKWFGCIGNGTSDNVRPLQRAADSALPLWFSPGHYLLNPASGPVFVRGVVVDWDGDYNTTAIVGSTYFNTTIPDDLSYPTANYPGPMSGSAFYWVSAVYSPKIKGISFENFSFVFGIINTPSTPTFEGCYYINCNCFTFWYLACQIPVFRSVIGAGALTGPLLIAGSTAAPVGSPYAGHGAYTFYIQSIIYEGNSTSFGAGHTNAAFDTWFQNSILRPTVSNAPGNPGTGTTIIDYTYPSSSLECRPSGFMFFVAGRTTPGVDLMAKNLYLSYGGDTGCGMFNTNVNIVIDYYGIENEPVKSTLVSHFIIGSVNGLSVNYTTTEGFPYTPLINYTGKDSGSRSNGTTSVADDGNSSYINTYIGNGNIANTLNGVPLPYNVGLMSGVYKLKGVDLESEPLLTATSGFGTSEYSFAASTDFRAGACLVQDDLNKILSTTKDIILPTYDAVNFAYCSALTIDNINQPVALTGTLRISVLDIASGETDYGEFFINTPYGLHTLELTTAANNGDTSIEVSLSGGGAVPYAYLVGDLLLLIGGVGVLASGTFGGAAPVTIPLKTPIGGLPSGGAPIGTLVTSRPIYTTITPMKRGIISLSTNYGLMIESNRFINGATAFGPTDSAVAVKLEFTSCGEMPVKEYSSGHPTTANWSLGAKVYELNPVPGGPIGYVCTSGGATPTWNAFGIIEPTNALTVSSTTTAGTITATASQLAGQYFADGATQTAAFTVTTDTAANILAAMPNAVVGTAFKWRFINNDQSTTGYAGTLAGGTGVTVGTILPNPAVGQGNWEDYIFTFTDIGTTPTLTVEAVGGSSLGLL